MGMSANVGSCPSSTPSPSCPSLTQEDDCHTTWNNCSMDKHLAHWEEVKVGFIPCTETKISSGDMCCSSDLFSVITSPPTIVFCQMRVYHTNYVK